MYQTPGDYGQQPHSPSGSGLQPYGQERSRGGYLARSWALVTHDRGWLKPVLLLAIAGLVPVVGPLAVLGYRVEWARLVAWGYDAAPKQKDVQVGGCLASGWRSFWVLAGWYALFGVVVALLSFVPLVGQVLGVVGQLATVVASALLPVAVLRAAIYQRVGAGFKLDAICDMFERDARGIVAVAAISIVGELLIGLAAGLLAMLPVFSFVLSDGMFTSYMSDAEGAWVLVDALVSSLPQLMALFVALALAQTVLGLIVYGAAGLYVRQFGVAGWGASEDELPVGAGSGPWQTQQEYQAASRPTETSYYQQADDYVYQPYQSTSSDGSTHGSKEERTGLDGSPQDD